MMGDEKEGDFLFLLSIRIGTDGIRFFFFSRGVWLFLLRLFSIAQAALDCFLFLGLIALLGRGVFALFPPMFFDCGFLPISFRPFLFWLWGRLLMNSLPFFSA